MRLTEEELKQLPFGEIHKKDRTALQDFAYHLSRASWKKDRGIELSKSDEIALAGQWTFVFKFDARFFAEFVEKMVPEGQKPGDVIADLMKKAMQE